MKKVLILTVVLIAFACLLVSCKHKHSFGEWSVTKNPTCTVIPKKVCRISTTPTLTSSNAP